MVGVSMANISIQCAKGYVLLENKQNQSSKVSNGKNLQEHQ